MLSRIVPPNSAPVRPRVRFSGISKPFPTASGRFEGVCRKLAIPIRDRMQMRGDTDSGSDDDEILDDVLAFERRH